MFGASCMWHATLAFPTPNSQFPLPLPLSAAATIQNINTQHRQQLGNTGNTTQLKTNTSKKAEIATFNRERQQIV